MDLPLYSETLSNQIIKITTNNTVKNSVRSFAEFCIIQLSFQKKGSRSNIKNIKEPIVKNKTHSNTVILLDLPGIIPKSFICGNSFSKALAR
ncbi:MAG TPA: hypothetical protein DCG52_06435 [Alphaproteobacteria bacterium]|nr:hypothetical protein [Alphaproteobacteria bacterium]